MFFAFLIDTKSNFKKKIKSKVKGRGFLIRCTKVDVKNMVWKHTFDVIVSDVHSVLCFRHLYSQE